MKNNPIYETYGCKVEGEPCDRWPYKSLKDPNYIKDKNKTFRENGNGWWFRGNSNGRKTLFTRDRRKK